MNKRLVILLGIAHTILLNGMQPNDTYDCESLKKEFAHFQQARWMVNQHLEQLIKNDLEYLSKDQLFQYPSIERHIAALICYGANPNLKVHYHQNGISKFATPLDYAVKTKNKELVFFIAQKQSTID
jgi:hypothetical protein